MTLFRVIRMMISRSSLRYWIAVYIIELSQGIGYLSAVETEKNVQLERYIFHKNQIFGDNKNSHSHEHVFGALTTLTDVSCVDNPDFDKPIY